MTIKTLRTLAKMTQREFSEYLNIPFRTIQDWEYEKRIPPSYVVELIEFKLKKECIKMIEVETKVPKEVNGIKIPIGKIGDIINVEIDEDGTTMFLVEFEDLDVLEWYSPNEAITP